MLPRGENWIPWTGETTKSKCRVANNSVLAGGASLTLGAASSPDISNTGGTVMVDGVVAEPM
jgi:hypothetical protein